MLGSQCHNSEPRKSGCIRGYEAPNRPGVDGRDALVTHWKGKETEP